MVKLLQKIKPMKKSPIREIIDAIAYIRKIKGIEIINCHAGVPGLLMKTDIAEKFKEIYRPEISDYTGTRGDILLLETLSEYFKSQEMNVEPKDILITLGGAQSGLFLFSEVMGTSGQILLTTNPTYPGLIGPSKIFNVEIKGLEILPEDNYQIDLKKLEKALEGDPTISAFAFTSPGNPDGAIQKNVEGILEIAKKYDIFVLVDATYAGLDFSEDLEKEIHPFTTYKKAWNNHKEMMALLYSLSKGLRNPGARLGLILSGNKEFMNHIEVIQSFSAICPSVSQNFFQIAFSNRGEILHESIKEHIEFVKERIFQMYYSLKELSEKMQIDIQLPEPQGAFYIFAKIENLETIGKNKRKIVDVLMKDNEFHKGLKGELEFRKKEKVSSEEVGEKLMEMGPNDLLCKYILYKEIVKPYRVTITPGTGFFIPGEIPDDAENYIRISCSKLKSREEAKIAAKVLLEGVKQLEKIASI